MNANAFAKERILIAVAGYSPAVLTETVWALAHQPDPWIPDSVVVISTQTGRGIVEKTLFQQKGWEQLLSVLKTEELPISGKLKFGASDSIRVIGDGCRDFDDISTPEESSSAADFILDVLRQFTERPDTELVASIAGGRKTMSALMLACMSLLGREQDRVCHVLADESFIAQNKGFLFPRTPSETAAARIQFYEIPFVRVRGWYEQETGKLPASYSHMVSLFRNIAPEAVVEPQVVFDPQNKILTLGGTTLELTPAEFDVALSFIQRCQTAPVQKVRPVKEFDDGFRRTLSNVRKKVEAVIGKTLTERLIPDLRKTKYEYRAIQLPAGRPKTS